MDCRICGAPDVIDMDGDRLVCPRCVMAMGRLAADPYAHPATVREVLEARSLDVLHLARGAWQWTSLWPGTGDARLLSGRVADGRL